jgi:hypothetical protein
VRWANAPGNRFDWMGVFRADDPGLGDYVAYAYTQAHFSGETQIMPAEPLTPGAYELRLMLDDSPTALARAPLVVRAR